MVAIPPMKPLSLNSRSSSTDSTPASRYRDSLDLQNLQIAEYADGKRNSFEKTIVSAPLPDGFHHLGFSMPRSADFVSMCLFHVAGPLFQNYE